MTMSSRPVQMPSMMMLGALLLAGAGAACGGNKRAPVRTDAAASTGGASGAGGSAGSAGVGGAAGSAGAGGAAGAGTAGSGGGSAGQGGGGGGPAGAGGNAGAGGSSPADPAPDAGTDAADAAASDATDATTATDATDASAATDATDAGTDVGTDAGTDTGTDAGSTDAGTCGNVRCPKLFTLVEACRPVGACTRSTGAGFPPPERLCYANGVKVRTMGNLTAFPPSQTVSWTYPDGNPCYSLDLAPQIVGGGVALTWKSPTDPLIARGTLDSMGNISITCEGETRQLTDNACAPPTSAAGCTAGTCE